MAKKGEHGSFHAKDYVDPPPAPLIDAAELKKWSLYRALIAEFIATLPLLYIAVLTVIGYKNQIAISSDSCAGVGVLGIAWAFGGMIFILVYCTAGISGGRINPAVTFGLLLARKVSLIRALLTWWLSPWEPSVGLAWLRLSKNHTTIGMEVEPTLLQMATALTGLVVFPKSMKKVRNLELKGAMAFALTFLLLCPSVKAADKPPTLEYGIIRGSNNAPPSTSTLPPPVNVPARGCNAENYCRHFTLTVENRSGTRVEAVAIVKAGAPLNRSAQGTEAIATGIAVWSLNKTLSGPLSVSINQTEDANSAQMLQLQALSRGIARMGLDVQHRSASMSSENMASLPPVDGSITITVDATSDRVDLKFFTQVKRFGETDIIQILEYAKAILPAIQN